MNYRYMNFAISDWRNDCLMQSVKPKIVKCGIKTFFYYVKALGFRKACWLAWFEWSR